MKKNRRIVSLLAGAAVIISMITPLSKGYAEESLSQVKVGNDFIYFLSIILQSISIVALPKFDH